MHKVIIPGEFHSLNEFIAASKVRSGNWNKGATMKRQDQDRIVYQLPKLKIGKPVRLHYTFCCRTKRRDLDNISGYFHKIFQDALVEAKILPDDNWDHIRGFSDEFVLDRHDPRVEIEIEVIE